MPLKDILFLEEDDSQKHSMMAFFQKIKVIKNDNNKDTILPF